MARKYRKRDKDGSIQRMIDAVGTILREKGHKFLYLNEIARTADVGKWQVNEYFGGVLPLVKAYILKKDYWLPHFDALKESPLPSRSELLQFYTNILQDQFRFFLETVEMQKFILWQISESHPLMRTISERRETEGLRLMALANAHFKDSDVNFKAVIAMILGGGYYIGLHASTKNSAVTGIDVNNERDKEIFIRTMGLILEWAWKAAEEKQQL
jgi:hypothetical protein